MQFLFTFTKILIHYDYNNFNVFLILFANSTGEVQLLHFVNSQLEGESETCTQS